MSQKPADMLIDHDHAPSPNPYRDLVEKYEALLEVQRQPITRNRTIGNSLMDELASSDFSSITTGAGSATEKDQPDDDYHIQKHHDTGTIRKRCARTPTTDYSEAETSSSGFADETSNKFTQTEETFLCTIADGEDKFSIYDDAVSSIDSRFRNRPEYRELFKEIFAILKKAAENKDDGEKLPLLDDTNPCFKVPPVTPAVEELPSFPDETESIVSSVVSEQSIAMSECITKKERKHILETVKKHIERTVEQQENKPPTTAAAAASGKHTLPDGRVLTPLKPREPLEYLAVSVNIRKKKKKGKNSPMDRSDSPILPTPPRIYYTSSGKKRRDMRPQQHHHSGLTTSTTNTSSPIAHSQNTSAASPSSAHIGSGLWNGSSMTIYNRSLQRMPVSPLAVNPSTRNGAAAAAAATTTDKPPVTKEFRRVSAASQNLQQLIKFELSYAEVLRRADSKFQLQQHRK